MHAVSVQVALRKNPPVRDGDDIFERHGHGRHPTVQGQHRDAPRSCGYGSTVDQSKLLGGGEGRAEGLGCVELGFLRVYRNSAVLSLGWLGR